MNLQEIPIKDLLKEVHRRMANMFFAGTIPDDSGRERLWSCTKGDLFSLIGMAHWLVRRFVDQLADHFEGDDAPKNDPADEGKG
jgi:hypothetical protein